MLWFIRKHFQTFSDDLRYLLRQFFHFYFSVLMRILIERLYAEKWIWLIKAFEIFIVLQAVWKVDVAHVEQIVFLFRPPITIYVKIEGYSLDISKTKQPTENCLLWNTNCTVIQIHINIHKSLRSESLFLWQQSSHIFFLGPNKYLRLQNILLMRFTSI